MLRRAFLCLFCLIPLAAAAQTQPFAVITASHLNNSEGALLPSGQFCVQPANSYGAAISYEVPSNGNFTTRQVCANVVNGAITTSVDTGETFQLANTLVTSPANICYNVTVTDSSDGSVVLGGGSANSNSGYNCVQMSSSWCSVVSGTYTCNFDLYQPTGITGVVMQAPSLSVGTTTTLSPGANATASITSLGNGAYQLNLGVPTGATGPPCSSSSGPCIASEVVTNPWTINLNNVTVIFDGASIDWGLCDATTTYGTCVSSSPYATGGSQGNWGYDLTQLPLFAGHVAAYYNHALPGETSAGALAAYYTSQTYDGVTVPSPHSICTTATSSHPVYYFLGMDPTINDEQATGPTISQATSISDFQTLTEDAHTDGCFVVLMTTTSSANVADGFQVFQTYSQPVDQAARDGLIYSDLLIDGSLIIPNGSDQNLYGWSVHPNAAGYEAMARYVEGCFRNHGCPFSYTGPEIPPNLSLFYRYQSSSYTLAITDSVVSMTGAGTTLTLPDLASTAGPYWIFNNTGGSLTIAFSSGASGFGIPSSIPQQCGLTVYADKSYWLELSASAACATGASGSSLALGYASYSSTHTMTATDGVVGLSTGFTTLTLPVLTGTNGPFFIYNASGSPITPVAGSGATLLGALGTLPIPNNAAVAIFNSGATWLAEGAYNLSPSALNLGFGYYSSTHTMAQTDGVVNLNSGFTALTLPAFTGTGGPFLVYNNSGSTVAISAGSGATLLNVPAHLAAGTGLTLYADGSYWLVTGKSGAPITTTPGDCAKFSDVYGSVADAGVACPSSSEGGFLTGLVEWLMANGLSTAPGLSGFGDAATAAPGSSVAAAAASSSNPILSLSTSGSASGDYSGWTGLTSSYGGRSPLMTFGVAYSASTDYGSNSRVWMGLVSSSCAAATYTASDNPSSCSYAMIRYSTTASDAYYECVTSGGSGQTVTSIGVAPVTSFVVASVNYTSSSVACTVNGTTITNTTNLPASTTLFVPALTNAITSGTTANHLKSNGWEIVSQAGNY